MPKLNIAAGIAQGAKSFVESYYQARNYAQQQKMQQNQVIIQAMYQQLADETLPHRKRVQILDALPGLVGAKPDVPLSQQWGLQDLLDDDIEVEEGKAGTPTGQAANVKTGAIEAPTTQGGEAEGVSDPGNDLNTSITLQGKDTPAKTMKYGDLSPAKYKQLIKSQNDKVETEREIEKARRVAEINFELQQKSWKAQGYTKEVARGVDEKTGKFRVLLANSDGDVKAIDMPAGFKPLELAVAEARGRNSTLPGAVRAYTAYFETQTNPVTGIPYTPEEAQAAALQYYKANGDTLFGLNETQKQLNVLKGKQEVSGTQPFSPSQKADDARADEQIRAQRETNLINLQARHSEAEAALAEIDASLSMQEKIVKDLEYKFNGEGNDDSITENYSPGDGEYQAAENALNRERQNLIQLKNRRAGVNAKAIAAKGAAEAYASKVQGSGSSEFTPEQKAKINFARKKNAGKIINGRRVEDYSDTEIWAVISGKK